MRVRAVNPFVEKGDLAVDFPQAQTSLDWRTKVERLGARQIANQKPTPYATGADFCRIFREDMNRLYLLSFLLTGDESMAEKCFVRGLEDAGTSNPVFREWARSWARRTIIQKAIEMIQPRPANDPPAEAREPGYVGAEWPEIAAVVGLPTFERFAFVMSVLERISDQECSLLLDCSRSEVSAARIAALQRIGQSAELRGKGAEAGSEKHVLHGGTASAFRAEALSQLPASA
jgi:DNA-directed RNA polymerase specialized sigma24 family protein